MRSKVSQACQRCRRLKIKCDAQRPCVLCSRAGVECVAVTSNIWRLSQTPQNSPKKRKIQDQAQKRTLTDSSHADQDSRGRDDTSTFQAFPSSSTISLVEETLNRNDAIGIHSPRPPNVPVSQQPQVEPRAQVYQFPLPNELPQTIFRGRSLRANASRHVLSSTRELAAILPSFKVAKLLVDTYFDRIHWFMLLFFQTEFRAQFMQLYDEHGKVPETCDLGTLGTTLAVCAVSLQYLGEYRSNYLASLGIDREALQASILDGIGRRLLNIIALESMEAVHTCVLLGTFYLFHGQPELAWPVCGCGLRVAQALNLHRKFEPGSTTSGQPLTQFVQTVESRKRCWWAIYEVETFCCMLYGYPLSIVDEDCDVEQLNPHFKDASETNVEDLDRSPSDPNHPMVNLLHYKHFMSKLSVLIKTALNKLYRVGASKPKSQDGKRVARPFEAPQIDEVVKSLNADLDLWVLHCESIFNNNDLSDPTSLPYVDTDLDRDIGAKSFRFDRHIFQLQKLVLRFAFENVRILVNRPLLWYKKIKRFGVSRANSTRESAGVTLCREAALQMSRLGDLATFTHASRTYAVAFMSSHILTAGVTLCMLNTLEPLGQHAQASKIGVHQLMKMLLSLRPYSQQAEQGLEVLKQLLTLVMNKESNILLDLPLGPARKSLASESGETNSRSNLAAIETQSRLVATLLETSTHSKSDPSRASRSTDSIVPQEIADTDGDGFCFDQHGCHSNPTDAIQYPDRNPHNSTLQDQATDYFTDSLFGFSEDLFLDDLKDHEQGWIWDSDIFYDFGGA